MANFSDLKNAISQVIKTNGNNEITGAILQNVLLSLIDNTALKHQYQGKASLNTTPGTPDGNVFYIASETGVYPNFGLENSHGEISIFQSKTSGTGWDKIPLNIASTNANRDYLYLGNKAKSIRAMQSGVVDAILDATLDIDMQAGKYYVFSLFNKPASGAPFFALYERDIATDEYSQLLLFNESNSVQVVGNIRLYTVGNSKVLVNWDAVSVTSISLTQADGVELSPRIFKNGRLNDFNKLVSDISAISNRLSILENQIREEIISANRHNPTTDLIGKSMSNNGLNIVDSPTYNLSGYIEVESGIPYRSSHALRKYWVYPELGSAASLMVESLTANTPFTPIGKYVRFIYGNASTSPVDVKFGKAAEDISGAYSSKVYFNTTELLTQFSDFINEIKIYYKPGANRHNPTTDLIGKSLSNDGLTIVDSAEYAYNLSDYIEVESGIPYRSSHALRKYWVYPELGSAASLMVESLPANTPFTPEGRYVRFIYRNSTASPEDVKFGKASEDISGEYVEFPFDKYGRSLLGNSNPVSETGKIVTIENMDKILFVGSSSTESHYALKYKSWFAKLNEDLDWLFITYAFSGGSADTIMTRLRSNTPSPIAGALPPSRLKPSYVHVGQFGNMSESGLNSSTSELFIEKNKELMELCLSVFNANLIVGTGYHDYDQYQLETALKQLADDFGADFIPWGYYNNKIMRIVSGYRSYKGFYGSAHPGTRSNNFYYQEAFNFFKQFQKPRQSIKFYVPRPDTSIFEYRDNKERALKYYSAQVGEQSLSASNENKYDILEPVDYTPFDKNEGIYHRLIAKLDVNFGANVVSEFILPVLGPSKVSIFISSSTDNTYKIYNNITNTFENIDVVEKSENLWLLDVSDFKYISTDKIKILISNPSGDILVNDVYFVYEGGKEKKRKDKKELLMYAGTDILNTQGFKDDWETLWNNAGGITFFKQQNRYGDLFVDLPIYLDSSTCNILTLPYDASVRKTINKSFTKEELYGDNNQNAPLNLRIEVYARTWCKIFDPIEYNAWTSEKENPFIDEAQISNTSYDYTELELLIAGANGRNAVLSNKVGLFWSRIVFDIYLPPFSGNQTFKFCRKPNDLNPNFDLEIADIIISRI